MEFTNDPEINCVFCGLGFSSVENVEMHIVDSHQSVSVEHQETRKMLMTNEEKEKDSSKPFSNHGYNGFKTVSFEFNSKLSKQQRIKCQNVMNQRKYLAGEALKVSNHGIISDTSNQNSMKSQQSVRSLLKHRCHKCFRTFLYHSTLLIHLHNHQYNAKCRFQCEKCGFKFSSKHILLRHSTKGCALSIIPDEINFNKGTKSGGSCEYCQTVFISRAYLVMHQRRVCRLASQFQYDVDTRHTNRLPAASATSAAVVASSAAAATTDDNDLMRMSHMTAEKYDRISSISSQSKDGTIKDELVESQSSDMLSVHGSLASGDHKYQSSSPDLSLKDSGSPVTLETDQRPKTEPLDGSNEDQFHWQEYPCKNRFKKPFQCEICKKHFSNRSSLSNHIKSHYSSRGQPFICRDCNQRFINLISLQDHRREICSQKTPVVVEEVKCPSKTKPTYSLSNFNGVSQVPLWPNSNQNQSANQPVACVHCNGIFYDRLELEEHALIKHSDEHGNILCLLCERTFTTNMALRVHLTKSHGFANGGCPGVSQNLPPMPRLDTNYNIADDIPHRKRRRRLFEYEKEYCCENCHRNFSTGQALGNHRRACMNMPNEPIPIDNTKPSSGTQNSKLHSIESLIFDNKSIRTASFKDDKNVFLAFH